METPSGQTAGKGGEKSGPINAINKLPVWITNEEKLKKKERKNEISLITL